MAAGHLAILLQMSLAFKSMGSTCAFGPPRPHITWDVVKQYPPQGVICTDAERERKHPKRGQLVKSAPFLGTGQTPNRDITPGITPHLGTAPPPDGGESASKGPANEHLQSVNGCKGFT